MKEFSEILSRRLNVEVSEEEFVPAIESLPRLVEEWRTEIKLKLCKLMPHEEEEVWKDPRHLELATTIFPCKMCTELIHYPRALFHACTTKLSYLGQHLLSGGHSDMRFRWVALRCAPWNCDSHRLQFEEGASEVARRLVVACSLDAGVTTKNQMDDRSDRFACEGSEREQTVVTWNVAVRLGVHQYESREKLRGFVRLSPRDSNEAIDLQLALCRRWPFPWLSDRPGRLPQDWYYH